MKPSLYPSLSAFVLVLGTLTLVGCGGAVSFSNPTSTTTPPPTGSPAPQSAAGPAIKGNSYGGHAPIENQHVYLLQPGTSGYGSAATSILGNNGATSGADGFTLTANTGDPNVPVGAMYETTDSGGNFNFTGAYNCTVGLPVYIYAYSGKISATAVNNNSIVQLAILGNCPSNGSFSGPTALSFVYMNEVSTVAAAYTFQPFTVAGNNSAWDIGIPASDAQAVTGIANAANTAAQLYNIAGGTQISSAQDGEGHIANYQTLGPTGTPNNGNGVVPQATIDTLANIVANCVDSAPAALGTVTSQCSKTFAIATDNGETTGTQPVDTATAVINISRFPAGNNSATAVDATYASDLFALGTGTVPYVPNLTRAPNDWTIAINYPGPSNGVKGTANGGNVTNSTLNSAESIAIDSTGQVWITSQGLPATGGGYTDNPDIVRWSNLGQQNALNTYSYIPGYVSIDGTGNAWTGNANDSPSGTGGPGTGIFYNGSNGVFTTSYGSGYYDAYVVITNQTGDAFFFASNATVTPDYDMWEYQPGGSLTSNSPINISGTTSTGPGPVTQNLTITAASETNTGGTYTYSFNFTYAGGTPPTLLAVGDTVPLTLANDPGTGFFGRVAATGWQNLTSVTVASVSGTSFTATGTTPTTNSNDGNGATTTAAINITAATETKSGGGTYTYTFDFTNVGTPGAVLAVGDTVPLSLSNDPGTGAPATAATGWTGLTTVKVATVNNTANPTSFTATGGTTGTANITTTNTNDSAGPVTETFNITKSSETHAGTTYTYTFTINGANTPTILVAGDKVKVNLANTGGGGGWTGLNTVTLTVTNPNPATNPTTFQATGTVATTNGGGNGATGTGSFTLNGATGTGSYAYTNANGATGTGSYMYTGTVTTTTPGAVAPGSNVAHGAIDSAGYLWTTAEANPSGSATGCGTGCQIARIDSTGATQFTPITTAEQPEFPAIDHANNAWIAIQETASEVYVVSPTGGTTILTPTGVGGSTATGALMTSTFGGAVDGNGNVWFANRAGNYGATNGGQPGNNTVFVLNGGVGTTGTVYNAISPPTNYIPEAEYAGATTFSTILDGSLNVAIDPSGNVWITNYTGGGVVELVGAAAPVVTPLSVAAGNNQLGQKP